MVCLETLPWEGAPWLVFLALVLFLGRLTLGCEELTSLVALVGAGCIKLLEGLLAPSTLCRRFSFRLAFLALALSFRLALYSSSSLGSTKILSFLFPLGGSAGI